MLITDFIAIGNRLHDLRKKVGMTQAEVAEAAGVSDRTYADIERGSVNMRVDTILRICKVLKATPDEIFIDDNSLTDAAQNEIWERLSNCSQKQRETALSLLTVYLNSL